MKLLTSGATLRQFVENALEPEPDQRSSSGSSATAKRPPSRSGPGARRPRRVPTFDALDRVEAIGAPTLILHGDGDAVVDSRNTDLLALRIPDARRRALPGLRPPLLLGGARALRRGRDGVPLSELTLGRWIRDRARTTPARVAIDCLGVETTYAELDQRSDRLAAGLLEAGLAPGDRVATLTGGEPRARRRLLRLREGGTDPDAAEHPPRRAGAPLPARGRRAGRPALLRRASPSSVRACTHEPRRSKACNSLLQSRSRTPRTATASCSSTPRARPASRRARC